MAFMRASGSSMPMGTAKRVGTNWLPALLAVASLRTLMGMPMRSISMSS
jgi:hypothetical protein